MIISPEGVLVQAQPSRRERYDIETHSQVGRVSRKIVLGRQENLLLFFVTNRLFGQAEELAGARAHLDKDQKISVTSD